MTDIYPSLYNKTGDIKDLNTLLVTVEELREMNAFKEQLQADAERYRFIRWMTMSDDLDNIEPPDDAPKTSDEMDAQIDLYIQKRKERAMPEATHHPKDKP